MTTLQIVILLFIIAGTMPFWMYGVCIIEDLFTGHKGGHNE